MPLWVIIKPFPRNVPHKEPVLRILDISFVVNWNKLLNEQSIAELNTNFAVI